MANVYCDLDTFKRRLSITGGDGDALILALLEHASRAIDAYADRSFYTRIETRYFDGSPSPLLLDADLLSVGALHTGGNGAGWGEPWGQGDFELLPYNGFPKHAVAATPWGAKCDFANGVLGHGGMKAVRIEGSWGFSQELEDTGAVLDGALSAEDAALALNGGDEVGPGRTLLIGGEQVYVETVSDAGADGGARGQRHGGRGARRRGRRCWVFRYPRPIVEACFHPGVAAMAASGLRVGRRSRRGCGQRRAGPRRADAGAAVPAHSAGGGVRGGASVGGERACRRIALYGRGRAPTRGAPTGWPRALAGFDGPRRLLGGPSSQSSPAGRRGRTSRPHPHLSRRAGSAKVSLRGKGLWGSPFGGGLRNAPAPALSVSPSGERDGNGLRRNRCRWRMC